MSSQENPDTTNQAQYIVLEHTADWALRITAPDVESLLITAAEGMNSLLVEDIGSVGSDINTKIEVMAIDTESLLVEWLNELCYWAEMEGILFHEFAINSVTDRYFSVEAVGGRPLELLKHIKAVTYNDLEIIRSEAGLEATVVFDV